MSNVFISYRREDSAPYAGRLADRLGNAFGADHVFMDVEDIPPGSDFTEALDARLGTCDAVVVVIGPRWLSELRQRAGQLDYVVHEIETALRRRTLVIPVLVGKAAMPAASELPAQLAGLARRQAVTVSDNQFEQDSAAVIRAIRLNTGKGLPARRIVQLLALAGILVAIGGSIFLLQGSRERAALTGLWVARMQPERGKPYTIRIRLEVHDKSLSGQVDYPTGLAGIQEGSISGKQLTFSTRHTPNFLTEPAVIRFQGRIEGRVIELTSTTPEGSIAKGTARRAN